MSTLRKEVFLGAPAKCGFPYGTNNSDSVVFENANFAGTKSQFQNDTFSKIMPLLERSKTKV